MKNRQFQKDRQILYISYIFPPLGGGGVYRVLKHTGYLPEFGWRPVVLTVRDTWSRYYDLSLMEEIPEGTETFRTHSLDLRRLLCLIQKALGVWRKDSASSSTSLDSKASLSYKQRPLVIRAARRVGEFFQLWFLFPDDFIGWVPFAFIKGYWLIRRRNIPVIITTSVPHSLHFAGWLLKKATGVKWVAEFRDAWAYHPHYTYVTSSHKALAEFLERKVFKNADRVVLAYGLSANQRRYPEFRDKFIGITNGYDESDFENLTPLREEGFNLLHVGSFYTLQTPEYFFQALSELLSERPDLKKDLKVRFFGHMRDDHLRVLKDFSLETVVKITPYIPHLECLRHITGTDVLLLFLGGGDENIVIPGKVFEYLRAPGRILAMVPEGETADIIRDANAGMVVNTEDIEGIKKALLDLYQDFKQKKQIEKNWEFIRTKERKDLARSLAKVLNEIVEQA